jgi:hypothetical protein
MTELKPCPFCGSLSMSAAKHDEGCFIRLYFEDILLHRKRSPEEYEKAWNTRTDDYREAADYWQRMYEQTVLERRTCTNGVKPGVGVMPRLYCSNCGCYTTLNKPDNATSYSESFMDWPFYCGNCGARVEGES